MEVMIVTKPCTMWCGRRFEYGRTYKVPTEIGTRWIRNGIAKSVEAKFVGAQQPKVQAAQTK